MVRITTISTKLDAYRAHSERVLLQVSNRHAST